jgi:hypothetical protein
MLKKINHIIKKVFPILLAVLLMASGVPVDFILKQLMENKAGSVADNFGIPSAEASHGPRVRTVEFFAGQDMGSAVNDNVGAQNNFPAQTVQLAESGADVIDAYIEVSLQFGGATTLTSTEGLLFFDSCTPIPCTPALVNVMNTASFGANSGESQTAYLRASVTSEATLAAYTGVGAQFSFQVGYCIDGASGTDAGTCNGTAAANVQGANAKLVVTYTYDHTSATQTNTVIYPLDSATDIGSRTALQASCTIDSNCPAFSYTTTIPEIGTQLSQFFNLQASVDPSGTTDWQTVSDIGGNPGGANTLVAFFEEALSDNGGWVSVLRSGVAGYLNNTVQSLEMSTNAANAYVMGGENYVTYTYLNAAPTRTKTVVYPVGEVQTVGSLTESALVGPTVYFPENPGVNVERAWFRIHTSAGGQATASTLNIRHQVGANPASAQRGYAFATDTQGVSDNGYFIYIIPASEYTELEGATGSTGRAVQMRAQWAGTARGAVSAELVVTYTYTSDTNGYMVSQNLFAGQQTTAAATSFSTATGAINPSIPETSGVITIRGASLRLSSIGQALSGPAANEGLGSNLVLSACVAVNTSTAVTDTERTRVTLWRSHTSVNNNDATTYTACYSSSEVGIHGGILIVTHQWSPPPNTVTVALDPAFSQPANVIEGQNNVIMGIFTFITSASAATVNSITIRETNTASAGLNDVRLYAEAESPCVFNPGVTPQIGTAVASFTSEAAVFGPTLGLTVNTTPQTCVFVEMDISTTAGPTLDIDIEITAAGDVSITGGTLAGTFPLAVTGATNIRADQGTLISTPIDFDWVLPLQTSFGQLTWVTSEPVDTDVVMRVRYSSGVCNGTSPLVEEAQLAGNAAGFQSTQSPLSLTGLLATGIHNRICLEVVLSANPNATASPNLDELRVTWSAGGGAGAVQQSGYRFFADPPGTLDVGTQLAAANTPALLSINGAKFRLRLSLHAGSALAINGEAVGFKLQFATRSVVCDTAFSGETYADITAATPIALADNTGILDDAGPIATNANDPPHGTDIIRRQTYNELNPFNNSQAALASGEDGLWDFALVDLSAPSGAIYCLRAVRNNGTSAPLDSYLVSSIPEVTMGTQYATDGTYQSRQFNVPAIRALNVLEWNETVSGSCTGSPSCDIRLRIRSALNQTDLALASWCGPGGVCIADCGTETGDFYSAPAGTRIPIAHNGHTWFQYCADFDGDGTATPILNWVRINYQ